MKKKAFIIIAVAAAVVACCCLVFCGGGKREMSFETAVVKECDISNSVTATGTIEPVTSVRRCLVSWLTYMLTITAW